MGIASELIERGWTQGALVGRDGSVCLAGAAFFAVDKDVERWFEVCSVIRDQLPSRNVGQWNDTDGRTFDEVLRVAKEADEILEAS